MAAVASALRNLAPKVALVLVSIAVSLVVIEVGLRVAGFEPRRDAVNVGFDSWAGPNVEMGWVNRAGTWKSAEPGNAPMSFDADGRRNDPAGNKPVNLSRILVVGCSFTQGYGVADDQTFSHFVNQSLPSAELLNFGTGAYGSYQSRLRVNHYFKAAHPTTTLVIYGLFYSHHLRDLAPLPWIISLTMQDGSYMVPPNIRMRSGEITESPGGPIGLWPLESRTASVALLHRAVMKLENRVTIGMVAPVFRHGILAMQEAVASNRAALLIVGLVPIAGEDLEWLQMQSRDKVIDFVACEHPDYDKDPGLKVGGVGHPSERLHRWWADCTLKALAARGYAVDASVLSSTGQPAVSKTN
jgi:hypothetical protein